MERAGNKITENIKKYFTDIIMIPLMILTTYSGLAMHILPKAHGRFEGPVAASGYDIHVWKDVHLISAFLWLFAMMLHVYQHWGWYKNTFLKLNFKKKKLSVAITVLAAGLSLTGIFLFLNILPHETRHAIGEFHDKFGEILVILLIFHIVQRFKWIIKTTRDIFTKMGNEAAFAGYMLKNNGSKVEE